MKSRSSWILIAALLAAAAAAGQEAQHEMPTFRGRAQVTAVDLMIEVRDVEGGVPADLSPADFEVVEDGEIRPVIAVEGLGGAVVGRVEAGRGRPAAPPAPPSWSWHSVIYIDQVLSSSGSIRRAAETLAAQAGRLTELGTVEIVAANPKPERLLPPTRSAALVEQSLLRLGRKLGGRDAIRQLRRRYYETLRREADLGKFRPTIGSAVAGIPSNRYSVDQALLARESLREEWTLLQRQQDQLLAWASADLETGARALLLVNDGFDLDPREFYLEPVITGPKRAEIESEARRAATAQSFDQLSRTLAATGWTAISMSLTDLSTGTFEADVEGTGRDGNQFNSTNADLAAALPSRFVVRPRDPLAKLADDTGGELVTGRGQIPSALARLGERLRLTYQVERLPDGELHRVEVRSRRPGLEIRAPKWVTSAPPQTVAVARARALLEGGVEKGDLRLVAAILVEREGGGAAPGESQGQGGEREATLQARVDLTSFEPLDERSALRVTLGVSFPEGEPFLSHQVVEGQELRGLEAWTYTLPLRLPGEIDRVSVVVEELASGAWGGALASQVAGPLPRPVSGRVRRAASAADADALRSPVDLLPGVKALVLLPPESPVVTGRVRLETLITKAEVDRVEFRLDGERFATVGPPFEARADFGPLPRPRTVEAIAYDAAGRELGRDSIVVNEGSPSFRVRLIEPRRTDLVGPVDVEAEVRLRAEDELARVEISWNDERVATLYEPPFRQRIFVPPDSPVGYLSARAHLVDGSTAEDTLFLNGPGEQERVEVRLVELYTVVADVSGRPVRSLEGEDFRVYEDGTPQAVAGVRDATEMPLSLGLLLDSSASMADALHDVQIAALDFLFTTLRERDRAFLVDFDSRPRLAQPLTSDLDEVARGVASLRPDGYTALCDAIVFGLVQMQEVKGRRALVVLSDGVGREERVGFATCLRMAQLLGVPIYAIVLDREPAGRSVPDKGIGRLAEASGGRVFHVRDLEGVARIYREIREELASQYLLTYYPGEAGAEGWRTVRVELEPPGLTARTMAGYYR